MTPTVALTIAGSDSGGGAGIQADLKTFAAHGVFGTTAITAVTAQNTRGVTGWTALSAADVEAQIAAVLDDFEVKAVKTGMLGTAEIIELVAAKSLPNLVVDPVFVATSGDSLTAAPPAAYHRLFENAAVITPNLGEASELLGRPIRTVVEMTAAARELGARGPRAVVIKGGHADGNDAVDVVWHDGEIEQLRARRVDTRNTHGTGCTLSAAIAARLALGDAIPDALEAAKRYITRALSGAAAWRLGSGSGPLNHFFQEEAE